MGYIVTLADGSFIVVDGGGNGTSEDERNCNHDHLYEVLTVLNKRGDGIRIKAWILTHEHWDHYDNFYDFVMKYKEEVTVDTMYYASPSYAEWSKCDAPGYFMTTSAGETEGSLFENMSNAVGGIKKVHVKSGDVFNILNCKLEVLYTWENLNDFEELGLTLADYDGGDPKHKSNNSSMVFRLYMEDSTFLCTSDIQQAAEAYLIAKYGDELKSDVMSMVHHGHPGATSALFDKAQPSILLWSLKKDSAIWHSNSSSNFVDEEWRTEKTWVRNHYLTYEATYIEHIYYAGEPDNSGNDDYDSNYTLTFEGGSISVTKTENPNR